MSVFHSISDAMARVHTNCRLRLGPGFQYTWIPTSYPTQILPSRCGLDDFLNTKRACLMRRVQFCSSFFFVGYAKSQWNCNPFSEFHFKMGFHKRSAPKGGGTIVLADLRLNCLAKQNQFQFQTKRFAKMTPDVLMQCIGLSLFTSIKNCNKWPAIKYEISSEVFSLIALAIASKGLTRFKEMIDENDL